MKLQSTTDFVIANSDENSKEYQHAKTLKLEPKLWMFVPCDDDGNVLEEPKEYFDWYKWGDFSKYGKSITPKCKQYQTALSKVWFKRFELYGNELFYNKKTFWIFDNINFEFKGIQSLEQLIPFNIEITENFGKNLQL